MEKDAASKLSKHSNEFNKKEVKILHFILFSWSRLQSNYLQVLKVGKKDDVFSTDEDSGDRIELHLVLREVEQQVQEAAVVRRQEGELQRVIG